MPKISNYGVETFRFTLRDLIADFFDSELNFSAGEKLYLFSSIEDGALEEFKIYCANLKLLLMVEDLGDGSLKLNISKK